MHLRYSLTAYGEGGRIDGHSPAFVSETGWDGGGWAKMEVGRERAKMHTLKHILGTGRVLNEHYRRALKNGNVRVGGVNGGKGKRENTS